MMNRPAAPALNRPIRVAGALILGGSLVFAGTLQWRAQAAADSIDSATASRVAAPSPRLHYLPALTAGATALWEVGADPEITRANFQHVAATRPLYAPGWLHLADLEARLGNQETALAHAARARELWSSQRILLWDIARFYLEQHRLERAMAVYLDLLRTNAGSAERVLALLLRIGVPERAVAESLLAPDEGHHGTQRGANVRLFRVARRSGDHDMVRIFWLALDPDQRGREPYAGWMLDTGYRARRSDWVCEAWIARVGQRPCFNRLINGDFSSRQFDPLRGWQLREYAGFRAAIDADGRLRIRFSGEHNVRLRTPSQRVPLRGSGSLVLTGRWKGEDITTRSGVQVQVILFCSDGREYFATDDRYKTWPWQEFSLAFDYADDCHAATVRINRARTDALDNKIGGTVWLDDLKLEPRT